MKVAIFTVGCKANQYESDALSYLLLKQGHTIVTEIEQADICIVNTCTVTHRADYDSRRILRQIIRKNPKAICIATGCYIQISYSKLAEIKGIDYLIGNREKPKILQLLPHLKKQKVPQILVSPNPTTLDTLTDFPPPATSRHTRAYLKIQDGCDTFCSYCIVPYARGRARSLPPDEVIKRVCYLQAQGVKEIVFTGIHLGEYGKDLSPSLSLTQLLNMLKESDISVRIRLSSLNPTEIDDEMFKLFAHFENLCPHLHISLQSGSNRMLQKMGRSYTVHRFKDIVAILRKELPYLAIGVDIIVGFPGETQEDFLQTYNLIQDTPVSYCHIFSYSDRPGTKAAKMPDKVPLETIKERVKKLRALDRTKRIQFFKANLGRIVHVLIEEKEDIFLKGHSENYISVYIKAETAFEQKTNQIVPVRLIAYQDGRVYGEMVTQNDIPS
ncbi:MAG: tRNA (N(6)-L-threonylcarbamoyladenosine(37)-C(2))-methylthiotransferase MtaB [Candidatus Desulfofervidaceae bacterium]|nr:tRNA (N(6)-L-threonylcarbamoyladenosine(37)-C(2))-methylthiotransferase MtaB [Candidatus Desulfofervidaceae bacterium]